MGPRHRRERPLLSTSALLRPLYPGGAVLGRWPEFPGSFAVAARPWLDLLHGLTLLEGNTATRVPGAFASEGRAAAQHLLLAEALGLVLLERRTLRVRPGVRQPLLRTLWCADDVDGLSELLRPFVRYRELVDQPPATLEGLPSRTRSLLSLARRSATSSSRTSGCSAARRIRPWPRSGSGCSQRSAPAVR